MSTKAFYRFQLSRTRNQFDKPRTKKKQSIPQKTKSLLLLGISDYQLKHRILNCLSITEITGIIQEFKAQKSNKDNNLSQIYHNQNAQKYTKEPFC